MKGDQLPAEHYVARHCRNKDLILTNGEPGGMSESAFEPKPDESDGLSANWLEFFGNDRQHNVAGVRSVTSSVSNDPIALQSSTLAKSPQLMAPPICEWWKIPSMIWRPTPTRRTF